MDARPFTAARTTSRLPILRSPCPGAYRAAETKERLGTASLFPRPAGISAPMANSRGVAPSLSEVAATSSHVETTKIAISTRGDVGKLRLLAEGHGFDRMV